MINVTLFIIIFIILFISVFITYYKNAEKLIRHHKYSLIIDILAWGSGVYLIFMGFLFSKYSQYNILIWTQIIVSSCILDIHISRFIIRIMTQKKKL
ncbi:hypothetical protein KY332_04150 [Candidatus Woesearchaeota archaeon]|nr:hypothetical protein [Candidatus Woesearchaeota archaeon]